MLYAFKRRQLVPLVLLLWFPAGTETHPPEPVSLHLSRLQVSSYYSHFLSGNLEMLKLMLSMKKLATVLTLSKDNTTFYSF